jgi:hypothetical protein
MVVCCSTADNYDAVLTLQDMRRLLTFFFTEQFLPLFRKIPVSSRQPNMVSRKIVEALRIVFCRSMADNYDNVLTLQDVGRLLMFFFTEQFLPLFWRQLSAIKPWITTPYRHFKMSVVY